MSSPGALGRSDERARRDPAVRRGSRRPCRCVWGASRARGLGRAHGPGRDGPAAGAAATTAAPGRIGARRRTESDCHADTRTGGSGSHPWRREPVGVDSNRRKPRRRETPTATGGVGERDRGPQARPVDNWADARRRCWGRDSRRASWTSAAPCNAGKGREGRATHAAPPRIGCPGAGARSGSMWR